MRRLLVTGSRDWQNFGLLHLNLMNAWEELGAPDDVILVHGACPTGADSYADDIWTVAGLPIERYPADWSRGRSAGPERNRYMVSLGADLCLAFIRDSSTGATGCARMAEGAGIPVRRYMEWS